MQRIFLVGSPRSGTTLLQSLLASHSNVISFPETHLFSKTIPIHKTGRLFKVYSSRSFRSLEQQLVHLGAPSEQVIVPAERVFKTVDWVRIILENLDMLAAQKSVSETHWLEKTPRHLHYAALIARADPSAKFIHIIRRGEHVVPSLYFATRENPDDWNGSRSIKKCVFWWNRSIKLSLPYLHSPNHLHISYEQLVEDTSTVLEGACRFLELDFEEEMLDIYYETAESLIEKSEHWKQRNRDSRIEKSNKWDDLHEEDRKYVQNHLRKFPYEEIRL